MKKNKYPAMLLSPLLTAAVVLLVFSQYGLYPFGIRTAAWCDMNQQVVPLLCQFKDILDGKSGMFLSFKNAAGMNFWGVFFFFLASPFSLLVKFVDKADMLLFANLLILMKMMCCSAAACFYFLRSRHFKSLDMLSICFLGFSYAVCGYTMLFYQNVIWLDEMYLFPLLLLSLEHLFEKQKPIPYTLCITAVMIVDYYIGYMSVIFVLLFASVHAYKDLISEHAEKNSAYRGFISGSVMAALMSAFVWLPSFIQYLSSGRRSSIAENLRSSEFISDFYTVLPTVISSAGLILLAARELLHAEKRKLDDTRRITHFILCLLIIPLIIEPINKTWHTGSYMSFPARYAFMSVFFIMMCAAYTLCCRYEVKASKRSAVLASVGGLGIVLLYVYASVSYTDKYSDTLADYTRSLSGSEDSFKGFLKLLAVGLIALGGIYALWRGGKIPKTVFMILMMGVGFTEAANNIRVYMTSAGIRSEATFQLQREVFDLADRIPDKDFYRVKTVGKILDSNMPGAMGYNSIGHYTSLTDEDYMFTMKRLGYSSVWMEVIPSGGTELTDALLSIGYQIEHDLREDSIYTYGTYSINPLGSRLQPAVLTNDLPNENDIPEDFTRADVQSYISKSLFGTDLVTKYRPDEGVVSYSSDGFTIEEDEILSYRIAVKGRQTLYFDCFDRLSNDLSEPIYDSFRVFTNGSVTAQSYPFSKENGVLKLGTFENENVIIQINTLKDVTCKSFGVFSLDLDGLENCISSAQTADLHEIKNGLAGTSDFDRGGTVLLALPYNDGLTVKVNGEKIPCREAVSCFTAFEMPAGHCDIEIKFVPVGFTPGLIMSIIGAAAFVICAIYSRLSRRKISPLKNIICAYLTAAAGTIILLAVYALPLVLNIFFYK